ncbi:tyrosine-protein kinase family protein [Paraburkholderia sp. GAS42]|uniref:tyrosine-protein kinase family protein n=1 Tax=Paraburkholderia sp. GAS42 TaxID=3035135 RepID=UPI003D2370D0
MYVVTFYSFKGGVGRSMALVNVAVQLAEAGKKVLLVDFDLEAPGLATFDLTRPKSSVPGIVDYVHEYVSTAMAPDFSSYVYKTTELAGKGEIWVMPAGLHSEDYAPRLNCIDWAHLYAEQEGYLMFEDLRRQWESKLDPDYVLIDSRTGHSDIEGICTRQLPDAVCMLFFPNEQNLLGLRRVAANVRAQNATSPGGRPIEIHFAASNVPDLDDEDGILDVSLERFRRELRYDDLSAKIRHYPSLSLLNQEIFSLNRPKSRLAREYCELKEAIVRKNLKDRDAAISLLRQARRGFSDAMTQDGPSVLMEKAQTIIKYFPDDFEVRYAAALFYETMGKPSDALALLSVRDGDLTSLDASSYAVRARLNFGLDRKPDAMVDLQGMLRSENAELKSFLQAVALFPQIDSGLYLSLDRSVALRSLSPQDQFAVAIQMDADRNQLAAKAEILSRLLSESHSELGKQRGFIRHEIALAAIGVGDFSRAIQILENMDGELSIADKFNLAMATWGRDGAPSHELFSEVLDMDGGHSFGSGAGANYLQCLGITNAILGNSDTAEILIRKARDKIKRSNSREFSAWEYLAVGGDDFLRHLGDIERMNKGEHRMPLFMEGFGGAPVVGSKFH